MSKKQAKTIENVSCMPPKAPITSASEEDETIMVRMQDGSMEDVRQIKDSDLYETHLTHVNFLGSLIYIAQEAFTGSGNDPEPLARHFSNLAIEIDQRFDYIREIGHELYRRLNSREKKTAQG